MVESVAAVEGGVPIQGWITSRSRRFIEVELASGHFVLRTSLTIPLIVAGRVTFVGTEGEQSAVALLRKLHRQAQWIVTHRAELKVQWHQTKRLLDDLQSVDPGADHVLLGELRSSLRRRFKQGLLGQREYQAALVELKQRNRTYQERRRAIVDSFMAAWAWGLDLTQVLASIDEI